MRTLTAFALLIVALLAAAPGYAADVTYTDPKPASGHTITRRAVDMGDGTWADTGVAYGAAAHGAAAPARPHLMGCYAEADAAGLDSAGVAEGDLSQCKVDVEGRLFIRNDHPNRFSAIVVNSAATTLTEIRAAPGAGASLYITDILGSASVISTTTADQYLVLKTGTGTNCATGTAVVWASYNTAHGSVNQQFMTPIKLPANSALCWMHAATGSKTFVVNGYIAP